MSEFYIHYNSQLTSIAAQFAQNHTAHDIAAMRQSEFAIRNLRQNVLDVGVLPELVPSKVTLLSNIDGCTNRFSTEIQEEQNRINTFQAQRRQIAIGNNDFGSLETQFDNAPNIDTMKQIAAEILQLKINVQDIEVLPEVAQEKADLLARIEDCVNRCVFAIEQKQLVLDALALSEIPDSPVPLERALSAPPTSLDSLEASQQQVDTEVGSFVLLSPGERAVNAKTKHAAGQISDADFIERVRKALIEAVPNPTSSISSNYDLLTSSDVEASRSPRLDSAEFEHKE